MQRSPRHLFLSHLGRSNYHNRSITGSSTRVFHLWRWRCRGWRQNMSRTCFFTLGDFILLRGNRRLKAIPAISGKIGGRSCAVSETSRLCKWEYRERVMVGFRDFEQWRRFLVGMGIRSVLESGNTLEYRLLNYIWIIGCFSVNCILLIFSSWTFIFSFLLSLRNRISILFV